jgi:nicotine blue oxidoreductase
MGEPKALLRLGGRSALEWIVGCCRDAGCATPLVVTGHHGERTGAEARRLDCSTVNNPLPDRGQLSSLQTGLRSLPERASGFLIWPVDVPLVATETLRALLRAFDGGRGPGPIVLPSHEGRRGHPVLLATALAGELLALDHSRSARDVLRRDPERVQEVVVDDARVLDRLNTPEDLRSLLAATGGSVAPP